MSKVIALLIGGGGAAGFGVLLAAAVVGYSRETVRHAYISHGEIVRRTYQHSTEGVLAIAGLCALAWVVAAVLALGLAHEIWTGKIKDW